MVNVCCVEGCVQTKDVTYFNVPNSRTLRKKWLEAFTPNCKVTNHSVVCSKHFLEEQYDTFRGKKRLKAKVIPSIFDNKISVPKPTTKKKPSSNQTIAKESKKNKGQKSTKNEKKDKFVQNKVVNEQNNESIVQRTEPITSTIDSEANKDIEEIITNYHIKQIRPINRDLEPDISINVETDKSINLETNKSIHVETHKSINLETNQSINLETDRSINLESNYEIEDLITNFHIKQTRRINNDFIQESEENQSKEEDVNNVIDVDNLRDPVFIEVSVDKGEEQLNNEDCLMLLESVQCDVDPTSLMLEDLDPGPEPDLDDDVVDLGEKKEDPISLLTSSDEDDVIIQEPKIDTVEVSDETDEDDVPLVKLIEKPTNTKKRKSKTRAQENIVQIMWGLYEYYCMECHFRTTNKSEYKKHSSEHPTVIQVCQVCGYTTASKSQLLRHKRKHKQDKKLKCHLCDFKARHNMSLIYHLKSHDCVKLVNAKKGFKCDKCGFTSDVKVDLLKHIRLCSMDTKNYECDKCEFQSTRRSGLKLHKLRRHRE